MLAADRTHRFHEGRRLHRATSSEVRPQLIEALELLGVFGFVLFFWLLQLLAAD